MNNLDLLKKKILFNSMHRGTKEMDLLLTRFVKKHIETFNEIELKNLDDLLNIDDEILYKWYLYKDNKNIVPDNSVSKKLKKFKL